MIINRKEYNASKITDDLIKECIYLSRSGLKKANEILELVFLNEIALMCFVFLNKNGFNLSIEEIISISYFKYWSTLSYLVNSKNNFRRTMSAYINNWVRNDYKVNNLKSLYRNMVNMSYLKTKNIIERPKIINSDFNKLEEIVKNYKVKMFKNIFYMKKDGYSHEEISKKLNKPVPQITYIWNYHRKIIIKIFLDEANVN